MAPECEDEGFSNVLSYAAPPTPVCACTADPALLGHLPPWQARTSMSPSPSKSAISVHSDPDPMSFASENPRPETLWYHATLSENGTTMSGYPSPVIFPTARDLDSPKREHKGRRGDQWVRRYTALFSKLVQIDARKAPPFRKYIRRKIGAVLA